MTGPENMPTTAAAEMTGEIHPEEDQGRGDDHSLARHCSDRGEVSTEADIINDFLKKKIVELRLELAKARVGEDGMISYQMKLEKDHSDALVAIRMLKHDIGALTQGNARLKEESSALREQLRLANLDAFNLEAELNDVKDELYEERLINTAYTCPCDCR